MSFQNSEQTSDLNFFDRKNIENLSTPEGKLRLTDTDVENELALFCYNHCDNNEDSNIKQCRGLVYHNDKLILKAFPYTDEYLSTAEELKNIFTDFSQWSFYKSYEGALLRLFYFGNKWYLSTHRKLNAFRSKWASRESFGYFFQQALLDEYHCNSSFRKRLDETGNFEEKNILEAFQNTLDKNKQYAFLLLNNAETRIVCNPPSRNTAYHVGTFCDGELCDYDTGLSSPAKLSFDSLESLLWYMNEKVIPLESQGIMCFGPNNRQVKIVHPLYNTFSRVRGNVPSKKFRYLQIRANAKDRDLMYRLYPEDSKEFYKYEEYITTICKNIHNAYMERYVRGNYVVRDQDEFFVMSACHNWHLQNRRDNIVTLEKVAQFLNEQPATNVNRMIHKLIEAEKTVVNPPPLCRNSPAMVGISPGSSPSIVPLNISVSTLPPPKLQI